MRIEQMHISGYGIFSDQSMDELNPGLNILLGDNESGKSTCLEFLRTVLFGLHVGKGEREAPQYHKMSTAKPGGSVVLRLLDGRVWQLSWQPGARKGIHTLVQRSDGNDVQLNYDEFTLLNPEMTRQLYSAVYGFSLGQLQELSNLANDRYVTDLLYGAGFGLGTISLPKVLHELEEKNMRGLYSQQGKTPPVNVLMNKLEEVQAAIAEHQQRLPEYNKVRFELSALEFKLDKKREQQVILGQSVFLAEELKKLKQRLPELRDLQEIIGQDSPELSTEQMAVLAAHSLDEVRKKVQTMQVLQAELNALGVKQSGLIGKLGTSGVGSGIIQFEGEIASLQEQKSQYESSLASAVEVNGRINQVCSEPRFKSLFAESFDPDSFNQTVAEMQNATRELGQINAQWDIVRNQGAGIEKIFTTKDNKFSQAAVPVLCLELICLGLAALAIHNWSSIGLEWLLGGSAFFGVTFLVSHVVCRTRNASRRQEQIVEANRVDLILEKAHACFSVLAPLMEGAFADATSRQDIISKLESLNLEKFRDLNLILDDWALIPELLRQAAGLKQYTDNLNNICLALIKRSLPEEILSTLPGEHVLGSGLALLTAKLNAAKVALAEEGRLRGQLDELAAQQQEKMTKLEELQGSLSQIFTATKTRSFEDYEALYTAWQKQSEAKASLHDLRSQLLAVGRNILSKCNIDVMHSLNLAQSINTPELLLDWLAEINVTKLDEQLESLQSELLGLQSAVQEMTREQGALAQKAKGLISEEHGADLMFEKAGLDEQLYALSRKWAVSALARHYLTEAKEAFEAEHQTAVMSLASEFFRDITGGAYMGLDPSGEKDSFRVLTHMGEARLPKELSRGTTEQLYLSLRLALIANRATQAEPLPLVMDDILVNFDPVRTKRSVKSILALALSHQIFYFTCQPHMLDVLLAGAAEAGVSSKVFTINRGTISHAG